LKTRKGKYSVSFKKGFLVLLMVLGGYLSLVWGQKADTFRIVHRFEADLQGFATDKLKQIYVISPNQVLRKCNEEGKVLFEFSNRYLGTLGKVDASDPFDVLLFYPDYQTLLFLDRTMNVTADVRLKNEEFPFPSLVAMGRDRQIWIYDAALNTLNRIDRQGSIKTSSQDLSLLMGRRFIPNQLVANERAVYLVDPDQGVLCFDVFGQFQAFMPLPGLEQLQAFDQYLFYRWQGQYYVAEQVGNPTLLEGLPLNLHFFGGMPNWIVAWNGIEVLVYQK